MSVSRRKFLSLVGGGLVVAAATPATAFLTTRTPEAALAPWDAAGQYDDPRLNAMSYALLAPNPHNRQPWLAELVGNDSLILHRDKTRNLPVTDPFARQLTVGMGCFIELMRMAAAQQGYRVESDLVPEGEAGPIAHCRFVADNPGADPLFQHVMQRRSYKGIFADRSLDNTAVQPLRAHADIYLDGPRHAELREIATGAWMAEVNDHDAWQESVELIRIGKEEINANPDGITMGGPMLDSLALFGLFNRKAAADINNSGTRDAIERTTAAIESAPAFSVVRTDGNSRLDQLEAGRRWLRLNLQATAQGLSLRPVSQALQEYKAVQPFYRRMHQSFASAGQTVQMLGLLGYGEQRARTPRWRIETRLINDR